LLISRRIRNASEEGEEEDEELPPQKRLAMGDMLASSV
jgi:hypothetical protein